jgi:CRP-like cAMP-binding protein
MNAKKPQDANPFVRKLCWGAALSEEDKHIVLGLQRHVSQIEARRDILIDGEKPSSLIVILEGWACRFKLLENGKQQIVSILLPGDISEPFGVLPQFMDYSLGALTPVTLAHLSVNEVRDAITNLRIEEAFWWDLLFTNALERQHIVSLGRRTALERLAHMICELHVRLGMVGLAIGPSFDLQITQGDIADLLGLSVVHVNRTLQELEAMGLISRRGRMITILDGDGLWNLGDFDPHYLHLRDHLEKTIEPPAR